MMMAAARIAEDVTVIGGIAFLAMLAGSLLLDAAVRPRSGRLRRWPSQLLHGLVMTALFGLFLAGSGNPLAAASMSVALMAVAMAVSNAKYAMLGEPLLFSDLALVSGVVRHPRFYLTALSLPQRWLIALGGGALALALARTFDPRWQPHLAGALLCAVATIATLTAARRFVRLTPDPAVEDHVARFGLLATMLLYWRRWRDTPNSRLVAGEPLWRADRPELVIVVQCESFADPVALTGDHTLDLPGLAQARRLACQWGELHVSGFGAYTMRTEYGVLFGREEQDLGFRRFDPFLTALGETAWSLPSRLADGGYRSLFVHPHDTRFYGRNRLMPAAGFATLVDELMLPPARPGRRYLDDPRLGSELAALAGDAQGAAFIYAVTMGNHGPWLHDTVAESTGGLDAYARLVRESDAMLSNLIADISALSRPALLVFFGDHRPSIPGIVVPGGERHTPYVIIQFDGDGLSETGPAQASNLTPAGLHKAILDRIIQAESPPEQSETAKA